MGIKQLTFVLQLVIKHKFKNMKKNKIDQSSQNSDNKSNQPTQEKNKDLQKKKPGIDPVKNDPTRNDKPPLIISKL